VIAVQNAKAPRAGAFLLPVESAILVQLAVQVSQEHAMRIISFSDARNGLKDVCDQVIADADAVVIHRRDSPNVVVMSQADYDGMQETLYLLSSPRNAERLLNAVGDIKAGRVKTHPAFESALVDE
jgi:antitoxin YefM